MSDLIKKLKELELEAKNIDELTLREPTGVDAEVVAELYKIHFSEHILVKWNVLSNPEEIKKQFKEENKKWVVAEHENKIVGCGAIEVSEWNKAAELERIVVAREMRGKGIAKKICESLLYDIAEPVGVRYVFAHARGPEYGMQKALSDLGFEVGGIMPVFYVNHGGREIRENFVYMLRFLNGGQEELESFDDMIPEAKKLKSYMERINSISSDTKQPDYFDNGLCC